MSGSWSPLTVWRTGWWRWVCCRERVSEGEEPGWFPPWAGSATTRRLSHSRTFVSRHPWTATTWSRWTPTPHQATSTTAAPRPCLAWACTVAGTPTAGQVEATPTPDVWLSPARGRTRLNSCTSSPEEVEARDSGLGVRMRWQCERKSGGEEVQMKRSWRPDEEREAARFLVWRYEQEMAKKQASGLISAGSLTGLLSAAHSPLHKIKSGGWQH